VLGVFLQDSCKISKACITSIERYLDKGRDLFSTMAGLAGPKIKVELADVKEGKPVMGWYSWSRF
jgi:hypothetical protein